MLICSAIGSIAGTYAGFKLYAMFGAWALLGIIVIIGILIAALSSILAHLMKRPAIKILKCEDPEDVEEPK
jgi:hypothetical protein